MITRKTKYALRALIYLGLRHGGSPVHIADLAQEEGIPQKFLERILLELKGRGVLHSQKGTGGGYSLRLAPREIRMGDIVRYTDGPLALVPCVSKTAYQPCTDCSDPESCALKLVMKKARDAVSDVLDQTTLADLMAGALREHTLSRMVYYEI